MHAYLIIAHINMNQLKKLIKLLDYKDNDIFIHIDKQSPQVMREYDYSKCCKHSKVYQYSEILINWGSCEQIKCELFLMNQAYNTKNKYEYYHLISGVDLPLKSQAEIHKFFEKHKNKEFINFSKIDTNPENLNLRLKYYRLSSHYNILPLKNSFKIMRKIDNLQIHIQRLLKINRLDKNVHLYKGANWFSITNDLVESILKEKDKILKMYKNSYCCDEVFLQTYVMNNEKFKKRVYKFNFTNDCSVTMRKIDWNRGGPYTWRNNDFEELMTSDCLFARKFDEKIDNQIINRIYSTILKQEEENE